MGSSIVEIITNWIREFLIGCITGNIGGMFDTLNERVGEIAGDVGQTPQDWNGSIFNMLQTLSETVIIPIAGVIITFVLCYELIHMVIERNNMHDFDTFIIYKWVFKAFVAVLIVTHTFDITMAVFDVAQHVVQSSSGVITGATNIDIASVLGDMEGKLEAMETGDLFGIFFQTLLLKPAVMIASILIQFVLYSRMLEIYLYCSIGPIPFATMVNREWGQMGSNYLKGLVALGFQGFFIMVCVAVYAAMIQNITTTDDIAAAVWQCVASTALLVFFLLKTGSLSKSIFGAH